MKYPIVEDVRKHRLEHTRNFGGDLRAICENLREIQAASGPKIIRLSPRKLESAKTSKRPKNLR